MAPILDLSNSAHWIHIYGVTLYAETVSTVPPRYIRIPTHKIPVAVYERTLAVGSSSTQAKPNWALGFYLIGSVQVPGVGLADIASIPIVLGLNLIRLPNLHAQFSLKAKIPKWHTEMTLDIWKYVGPETDS